MRAVKENAYAKINLFLDVVGKRPDGFHDVDTVMHSIALFDTLTVTLSPARVSTVSLRVIGNDRLVTDDKNLAVRAARLFLERAAITAAVNIKLEKRIPVSAGLAGGSTDAAATLRAMNRLTDRYFSECALLSLALELGSDVPYCFIGGTARCEGRGEIMTKLTAPALNTVIAVTDEYVSTPRAYAALDGIYSNFDGSLPRRGPELSKLILKSLAEGRLEPKSVYNVFEDVTFPVCPKSKTVKARMSELGAICAAMSGSGPSVFGIFESEEGAILARDALNGEGYCAYFAKSV